MTDPISTEGTLADQVKYDRHHNVLIGNPPYDRVESGSTGGIVTSADEGARSLFDDIFDDAKQHTIFSHHASLYNLYVYFWRWAIWKVFEQNTGPAVVSMITASSWLTGPGFLGLRRLAREVADEITVLDLGGDNRGGRRDENVFNIESPVAVVTLIRHDHGDRTTPAETNYARIWGDREHKFALLADVASDRATIEFGPASSDWHAPFVPAGGGAEWRSYPALIDLLPWQQPGCKFGRTWPIAPTADTLNRRWNRMVATDDTSDRATCFITPSSGRTIHTKVAGRAPIAELPTGAESNPIVRYGYRSFDRQWAFQDPRLATLERPSLWASVSRSQVFMVSKPTFRLGGGPAAVVTVGVPDLDHFRGSYGGKDVIPLYRDERGTPNADPRLLAHVTDHHREADSTATTVTVERLFAYVFGVLAGTDYTTRFHAALETPGPRIPLTADPDLFEDMVRHGGYLMWLQTFGERSAGDRGALPLEGISWAEDPTRLPADRNDIRYDSEHQELHVADGVLTGVPPEVYNFEVSGMEVIPKWLSYRMVKAAGKAGSSNSPLDRIRPTTWSDEWSQELVEIVGVLRETLASTPAGVELLDRICEGPLILADALPTVPDELRKPPKSKPAASADEALFGDQL